MSRTAVKTSTPPAMSEPVPAPRGVRERRVRLGQLGLAVLLVAVGGLAAAAALAAVSTTHAYLAVARPVAVGTQLSAADLVTVEVTTAPGLAPIPASEVSTVVGKRAAVALVAGSLLTRAALTDTPMAGPGQVQVGIGLKPSQLPAPRLQPGDRLILVATAAATAVVPGAQTTTAADPARYEATVVSTTALGTDGNIVVHVAVATRDAPAVASLAAQGRIAVILAPAN